MIDDLLTLFNFQVTGGSSGIGKCIAIECYRQGAFITLVARDEVSKKTYPTSHSFVFSLVSVAVRCFSHQV